MFEESSDGTMENESDSELPCIPLYGLCCLFTLSKIIRPGTTWGILAAELSNLQFTLQPAGNDCVWEISIQMWAWRIYLLSEVRNTRWDLNYLKKSCLKFMSHFFLWNANEKNKRKHNLNMLWNKKYWKQVVWILKFRHERENCSFHNNVSPFFG